MEYANAGEISSRCPTDCCVVEALVEAGAPARWVHERAEKPNGTLNAESPKANLSQQAKEGTWDTRKG